MREKMVRVYVRDAEYAGRLTRFLTGRDRVGLRVERMTEREPFWRSREGLKEGIGEVWLTDDVPGSREDPGRGEALFILAEESEPARRGKAGRISFCRGGESIYRELLSGMGLSEDASYSEESPPPGLYGVFSPWGEEAQVTAALLCQELAGYGSCLYVSTGAFPMLYSKPEPREKEYAASMVPSSGEKTLGELFFRMEREDFPALVESGKRRYGAAFCLPAVAHYRDLWDIGEDELGYFFERLCAECGADYVVAVFFDVREALPMAEHCREFFFLHRASRTEPMEEWRQYVKNEKREAFDRVSDIVMPTGWEEWMKELEASEPADWLSDKKKRSFISGLWKEERHVG